MLTANVAENPFSAKALSKAGLYDFYLSRLGRRNDKRCLSPKRNRNSLHASTPRSSLPLTSINSPGTRHCSNNTLDVHPTKEASEPSTIQVSSSPDAADRTHGPSSSEPSSKNHAGQPMGAHANDRRQGNTLKPSYKPAAKPTATKETFDETSEPSTVRRSNNAKHESPVKTPYDAICLRAALATLVNPTQLNCIRVAQYDKSLGGKRYFARLYEEALQCAEERERETGRRSRSRRTIEFALQYQTYVSRAPVSAKKS